MKQWNSRRPEKGLLEMLLSAEAETQFPSQEQENGGIKRDLALVEVGE